MGDVKNFYVMILIVKINLKNHYNGHLKASYYFLFVLVLKKLVLRDQNISLIIRLKKVKLLINLDIVGTGDEGIAIVNAFEQEKVSKIIGKINSKRSIFNRIKLRGQAQIQIIVVFKTKSSFNFYLYFGRN